MARHHVSTVPKSWSCAACLAALVLVAAIGAFAPTMFSRLSANPIDSPDDLSLTASVAPVTFRQGDGGPFSETDDTYINSGAPYANFGTAAKLFVDGSGCKVAPGTVCKTLIQFPNFIGPNEGQVPPGSTIVSATLELVITNKGVTQDVYQVTELWTEGSATWDRFSPAGMPDTKPRDSVISPTSLGLFSINITSIVQAWVHGEPNEGILLSSDHWDGVDYESSESANPPTLTVQFSAPPPPGSPTITDLGTLPGDSCSEAKAINDAGQVVGWSGECGWGSDRALFVRHAFLWQDGVMTDLGTLPGDVISFSADINNAGQIVGWSANRSEYPARMRAFLWQDGAMTELEGLGGGSIAWGINDAGQVVGDSDAGGFLWQNGVLTDLGYPPGSGGGGPPGFGPREINDAGAVIGSSPNGDNRYSAFLWENGTWTPLSGGGTESDPGRAVNNARQAVGFRSGAGVSEDWLWEKGTVRDLSYLPPPVGWDAAYDINDAGQVVGESSFQAYRWEAGVIEGLGDFSYGSAAYGINNAGGVVGEAFVSSDGARHAVLWTTSSAPPETPRSPPSLPTYAKKLGMFPGDDHSQARGINNAGQIVGFSSNGYRDRPFLWDDGLMTELQSLGGLYAVPEDINEAGQIAGSAVSTDGVWRAVLWENGTIRDLGLGVTSNAWEINDVGQVVGSYRDSNNLLHAFVWEDGVATTLVGLAGGESSGQAINDVGQVVGTGTDASGNIRTLLWDHGAVIVLGTFYPYDINNVGTVAGVNGTNGAVLWHDGTLTSLPTLGGTLAEAWAINDAGVAVGYATTKERRVYPVLWWNGTVTNLSIANAGGYAFDINNRNWVAGTVGWNSADNAVVWWDVPPPPPRFAAQDLGVLPGGDWSVASAMNNAGQIVGSSTTASGDVHPFLWESGTMTDLGTLGGTYGVAYGINDAGQIVGQSTNASGAYHAFLWEAGSVTDLGVLPGHTSSMAVDINDAGQVVGLSSNASDSRVFLWENGAMSALEPPSWAISVSPQGINNAGQVVATGSGDEGGTSGLVWDAGVWTWAGGEHATDINEAGHTVAYGGNQHGGVVRAVLYRNGTSTDLGGVRCGDCDTYAYGLNDHDWVVGQTFARSDWTGGLHGFVWEEGVMTDLGTLGGDVSLADDVNEQGQIVGRSQVAGGAWRAVLWTEAAAPPAFDFTLSTNPTAASVAPGGSVDTSVIVTLVSGTPSELRYACSNLPTGSDCTFTPPVCAPTCSVDLSIATSTNTRTGTYAITIASEGVASRSTTFTLTVFGTATLSFQKGDGGSYSETDDTYISSGAPNANFGAGPAMFVDGSGCKTSPSTVCKALIQFPNIIGRNTGQVAPGSVVVSAILQFTITNPGGTQLLYQLTEGWTESGVTWNVFATPGSPTTKGTGISFNAPLGVITVNITAIVQNWVNGDANYGLFISSTSTDGVDYRSSESTSPPKLIVTVRSP